MSSREDYQSLAESLTGRAEVLVRFRYPPGAKSAGEVYRFEDAPGWLAIDISPDLSGRDKLRVFLHECSHIIMEHHKYLVPLPAAEEISGAAKLESKQYKPRLAAKVAGEVARREREADVLADEMIAWAEKRISSYVEPGASWARKEPLLIVALKFFRESEL